MDTIRELACQLTEAVKSSKEYIRYKEAHLILKNNHNHMAITKDYIQKQMALQAKQMAGQELSDEEARAYNTLTEKVMAIPEIAEYFQAQMQFGIIYQTVMDELNTTIDFDLSLFGDDV